MASLTDHFALLDHVPVGILVINAHYEIIFINRALEGWLRSARETLYRKKLTDKYPETSARKLSEI